MDPKTSKTILIIAAVAIASYLLYRLCNPDKTMYSPFNRELGYEGYDDEEDHNYLYREQEGFNFQDIKKGFSNIGKSTAKYIKNMFPDISPDDFEIHRPRPRSNLYPNLDVKIDPAKINKALPLEKQAQDMKSTYAIYVVPDHGNPFNCQSISKGIDWKGAHITIAGFSKINEQKLRKFLNDYKAAFSSNIKRWNPSNDSVTLKRDKYIITSRTLDKLKQILQKRSVENLKGPSGYPWHITCSSGSPGKFDFRGTKWSLIMAKRTGDTIEQMENTRVPFYDEKINTAIRESFEYYEGEEDCKCVMDCAKKGNDCIGYAEEVAKARGIETPDRALQICRQIAGGCAIKCL